MRKRIPALALAFFLSGLLCVPLTGCGGRETEPAPSITRPTPPEDLIPDSPPVSQEETSSDSTADLVLSSLTAAVDGGRTLRLDAIGAMKPERKNHCGIKEVQVYENGTLIQTVSADIAPLSDGAGRYTEAASVEGAMAVRDMNFDGFNDLELSDWIANGNDPHHFWLWDPAAGQYRYAFTLRGAEVDEEKQVVISTYIDNSIDYTDTYQYSGTSLVLMSRVTRNWKLGTEDFPLMDYYDYPNGTELLYREEYTDYNENGVAMREVREPVDGVLTPVRIEQLEVVDGELRVVNTFPVEPPPSPGPENGEFPEGYYPGEGEYPGEYPEGYYPGEYPEGEYPADGWETYPEEPDTAA